MASGEKESQGESVPTAEEALKGIVSSLGNILSQYQMRKDLEMPEAEAELVADTTRLKDNINAAMERIRSGKTLNVMPYMGERILDFNTTDYTKED